MTPSEERNEWLRRTPDHVRARKLGIGAWIVTALVLVLVGLMRRPELRIVLPEGISFAFLPPVHAAINTIVSVLLIAAILAVKSGRILLHRKLMLSAMGFSVLFLLGYVAYHFTNVETKFGGTGTIRGVYFFLLITHIAAAAVSLPLILLTFINAWTNRFDAHRKMARWVFPIWLYVAVTGPICYLMLRPYYP